MSEHEEHPVHPLVAGIVVLIVAGIFGWIFSLMEGGSWTNYVVIIAVALAAWGLVTVLILDKE